MGLRLGPKRIEELDSREVLLVVRDEKAVIDLSDRGDLHIESASWPSGTGALRHQEAPNESCPLVKPKDAATK